LSAWRHLRAIALLPGTVAVVVPAVLLARNGADFDVVRAVLGAPLVVGGFAMWVWTVRLFARIGQGTLAPWDPTERLVVEGPYAHVRNPMITAVLGVLLGEALIFGSAAIAIWAAIFAVVNHVFFLAYEEPAVERRFGEEYGRYKENVPRWVPRRTHWRPTAS
jgi:protein-S-isoprenylcysteine O-methyltransferase Ste14